MVVKSVLRTPQRENNQTEQETSIFIRSDAAPEKTPRDIIGATALQETTLPLLHEMVVKQPSSNIKRTTIRKNNSADKNRALIKIYSLLTRTKNSFSKLLLQLAFY